MLSFEGVGNDDNLGQLGRRVLPPDPNGDVGPNHYVQTVNLLVQVFDKATGTAVLPVPVPISSLFASFGGPCEMTDDGDPIVLYDSLADRWLISQFALSGPPFHQCVACSQSGDPTGAYFLYDFEMPNNKLNDYSKFGVWPEAYYMTDNQFTSATGPFAGGGVFAFDRAKMLVGDPSASFLYLDLAFIDPTIGGMLPADLDGPPPPIGSPSYLAYFTATEFGDRRDALRVFELHADFSTPPQLTFTERPESPIATAAFDPLFSCGSSGQDCIPQPSPADSLSKLDVLADRLMHRLQYRNFGTHESLVVNHTVDVSGTSHAGVRYYELRRNLPGGAFFFTEQASFAPDSRHRWMGSAAMDHQGNLAVGYSVSSAMTFPSARYAGRLATDPPGGLFQGEGTLQAGAGSQTSPTSRWGDYSMLTVDPVDGCTFWYTTEYYSTSSSNQWRTRIGSFKFPACTPLPGTAAVDLGKGVGRPGGTACLPATLTSQGALVAATTNDVGFDASLFSVSSCTINPTIGAGTVANKQAVPTLIGPGIERVAVGSNDNLIADGLLYTCTVPIAADASLGTHALSNVAAASDVTGSAVNGVTGTPGQIVVTTCTGDCNGDGGVSIGEVTRCVNLFLGQPLCNVANPTLSCPAADVNHDGKVAIGEVTQCVSRFLQGCG